MNRTTLMPLVVAVERPSCRSYKFSYRGIGSSRLDCGDEVRHPSRLVPRKGEMMTGEVCLCSLNVCGGMDDKIDDVCELMKDRRLGILRVNETKRKGSGGAIKRGSFDRYLLVWR
ncbi:hypothetical protein EVAR_52946_1 [Eumeta japonica]|uniref:Endonuclease/exonuclease/phosphatase domain-containing protein n=1 Tax=Eumeta variegata TaxID=151549 RepID=A0A4C1XUE0_EUMVA|nr:hypothetical protein EVAR_52946_1 [Eumeta japonica]